ncbi:MAG: 16S rRNA (guanine(527)-N(7))-methyltransferase RsmG [Bacteroidales bacterium]|nr:16S rRNA (guanine(527)-N(7))-methyltransferase RsmG [Bacteroidales bacterium]MDD2424735.1 16S rRNA (guanine(527)-N(7))-methyltransferase RsmG [Bacteroidales bacterium]MDD3989302.1 16S rRNA (guanine(527)-N(7))-methyltransferase RsmG [Bacteroidales bacterium]MDD4639374.1 16S rRNA (guanine(527)-N(7))-methyltransferase RsmG [Bacteroidales bacterium]
MEEIIFKYFPDLSQNQKDQISALYLEYKGWNERINVISRKDFDNLYIHHILHSLAIAKFSRFPSGSAVMDLGTGGGFPGIPLAILFPDVSFLLCDSIAKKILVAGGIASSLALKNVKTENRRAEDLKGSFDFIVSRAVAQLEELAGWSLPLLTKGELQGKQRGLIALKGGDLEAEIEKTSKRHKIPQNKIQVIPVSNWFSHPWFEQKYLVFIPAGSINICR